MKPPWILVDMNNLAWRAFHTTGGLSFQGIPTGVTFGVLGTIIQLESTLNSSRFAFCFDSKESFRKELCKEYKQTRYKHRQELSDAQKQELQKCYDQINLLRKRYLKEIGFKNIFQQRGYEADDIIASLCRSIVRRKGRAVIVSSDSDLYQMLSYQVSIWNPHTRAKWTIENFKNHFGISPQNWVQVKAMAGCSTDDVRGITGCGEKTAIKFLNHNLPEKAKVYQRIVSKSGRAIIQKNLKLVRLPFEGVKEFTLKKDGEYNWQPIMRELGITSLNPDLQYKERDLYSKAELKERDKEVII